MMIWRWTGVKNGLLISNGFKIQGKCHLRWMIGWWMGLDVSGISAMIIAQIAERNVLESDDLVGTDLCLLSNL